MSESKHAPGPWKVGEKSPDTAENWHPVEALHEGCRSWGSIIAWALAGDGEGQARDRALANARLIAAAPGMLTALHEVEEFLDQQADADDGRPNRAMSLLVEVRAALAKATGSDAERFPTAQGG